jgi:DNA-binding transcriptional regulator YhcF (GntR family)
MKYNPTSPIYLQIIDCLKKDIVTGVLAPGVRLDSVRALSDRFEVNLNTMQRACSELEKLGAISTQRGIGSFVTNDKTIITSLQNEMSGDLVDSFISGMQDLHYPEDKIIELIRKKLNR